MKEFSMDPINEIRNASDCSADRDGDIEMVLK
jgi:hypothetical protein